MLHSPSSSLGKKRLLPTTKEYRTEYISQKTISNIQETIARGARVILLTTHHEEVKNVQNTYYLPDVEPTLQAILVAIPLQLLAYYTACLKDCDVDKPRNLAKSVTVE